MAWVFAPWAVMGNSWCVAHSYVPCDRDQLFLMPESMRDWLPDDHLGWFVLDLVATVDTADLHDRYCLGGVGRQPFDPEMLLALLVYAYCVGVRSSREIERRCRADVAFRVIAANHAPDHTTIARFRQELGDVVRRLFADVLELCAAAGMVRVGVVAVDGTKMGADASLSVNRTRAWIEAEVACLLAEADQVDGAEDATIGEGRGDELPAGLGGRAARLARLQECRDQLDERRRAAEADAAAKAEARAAKEAAAAAKGHRVRGKRPNPPAPFDDSAARANPTDPDSRIMRTKAGWLQGYNAQAAATADQVIVAAAVTQDQADTNQLIPMAVATRANLAAAGVTDPVRVVLGDAGYFSDANVAAFDGDDTELIVNTTTSWAARQKQRSEGFCEGPAPDGATPGDRMRHRLRTPDGAALYARRAATIEPVFANIKDLRGFRRFMRRGRQAVENEWQLICATHNILKAHRFATGTGAAFTATT